MRSMPDISSANKIEQISTVRFDANLNPLGIPDSIKNSIVSNISLLNRYPGEGLTRLKGAIGAYVGASADNVTVASCSSELFKQFIKFTNAKKALLVTPGVEKYEKHLASFGCAITRFATNEDDEFVLNADDFVSAMTADTDIVFISNPNRYTSKLIDAEAMRVILDACKAKGIFLVVDEEYMDFVADSAAVTAVPFVNGFSNLAVVRNTAKYFAVPGLRLAYTITSNSEFKSFLSSNNLPFPVNIMAENACAEAFADNAYISRSNSMMATERNLVYSALTSRKTIKLYKPFANYILVKLLRDDITAADVAEYCENKGLYIRNCSNIAGLDNKYIRFCFMNPGQNDLLVNTILEIV